MSNFRFWEGIREDTANMISEVSSNILIDVPKMVYDAYGNQTGIVYSHFYEPIWIRPLNEVMQIENIGEIIIRNEVIS